MPLSFDIFKWNITISEKCDIDVIKIIQKCENRLKIPVKDQFEIHEQVHQFQKE